MKVDAIIQRYQALKREQDLWIPTFEALSQYILMRKLYWKGELKSGPFVFNLNYDGTAIKAARVMAASIFGQTWPSASESFEFVPEAAQEKDLFNDDDIFSFLRDVNAVMATQLGKPESGFLTAWLEAITDLIVFGTAFIFVQDTKDMKNPVRFKALDAKSIVADCDEAGNITTAFIMHRLTVASVVAKYKLENCSREVQTDYRNPSNHQKRVNVLQAIMPRAERDPYKLGRENMPYASIHIDITHGKHVMLNSGFNEMPLIGMRFYHNPGEVLGRSPAMDALSDIKELNKEAELYSKAGEFALNPMKVVYKEQVMGSLPTWKSGGWIMAHTSGRMGSDKPPVEALQTVTNPSWARERINDLREQVEGHFLIDRLTDLNNRSRQTMGEAQIRNSLREHITGPVLNRVLTEGLQPLLDRTFNILLEAGFFGVIEGSLQDYQMQAAGIQPKYLSQTFIASRLSGVRGYKIKFLCPAARASHQEEAAGMAQLSSWVLQMAQLRPEVLDLFDWDQWTRREHFVSGASLTILNSQSKVDQLRRMAAEARAQQEQMMALARGAEILKSGGKGLKDLGDANVA